MPDDGNSNQSPLDPINLGQAIGNNEPPPNVGASNATPRLAPQPVQGQVAGGKLPLLGQFLADVIKPPMQMQAAPGQMATMRPVSRANEFEGFLGQFLFAMGQGMQAAGHGPGAFGRGFGGAMTAPFAQQQMQNNLAQQQAQVAGTQAETQLKQTQAQQMGNMATLNVPGMGPVTVPVSQLGNILKGAPAAAISGQARIQTEQLKAMLMLGQVGSVQSDANGNKIAFNKFGQPLGQLDGAIDKSFLNKFSSSIEYKEDANGNLVALPKTTVSGIKGGGAPAKPPINPAVTPTPKPKSVIPAGPNGPTVVPGFLGKGATQMMVGTDSEGSIVAGTPQELTAAGVTKFTKMDANDASKVTVSRQLIAPNGLFSLVNQDLQKLGASNLGPVASRWNDYMSGKVGTGADFAALRTHMGLLGTALMQAHMGNKGGEGSQEHFTNLADYRISDAATLRSALAAEYRYVTEKAARPKTPVQ